MHVGERVQLDATLAPASVSESVLVIGESPQLETGSATIGQVINSKLISEIPLGDGTAYGLTRLIPGASFERSYALQRPMDNDNLRGMTITGTINSEFTIDGSSNVVSQARAGIQPPADAIEEFKVETAAYDAQIGHTGAGAVNLALKTGTNQFHGSASYYNRDDSRSANLFASNQERLRQDTAQLQPVQRRDWRPDLPQQDVLHVLVRKAAGRHDRVVHQLGADREDADGDFSELLSNGVQIFDPRTARLVNGVVVRDPFPGNIIPADRINPVARNVLGYFPGAESGPGGGLLPEFLRRATLDVCLQLPDGAGRPRVDAATSAPTAASSGISGGKNVTTSPARLNGVEITRGATDRFNFNYAVGHTAVLSPTTVFDLKGSWLRFNDDLFPLYTIDPASLGFSAATAALFGDYQQTAELQPSSRRRPPQRDASRGSGPSRAASTADARSRSTTSRSLRR